jgi:riboflavin synthase
MFTGIIRDIGTIRAIEKTGDWRVEIATEMNLSDIAIGASIACNGCCLTVVEKQKSSFFINVSTETLNKSMIGDWQAGTRVNLEPSLQLGDSLDGHFVFGHVDAAATLETVTAEGDSHRLTLRVPAQLVPFLAPKGSVALDGVSLTVNEVDGDRFGVNIIPHTWANTTLGLKKPGDRLNIEIDMLARYVARLLERDAA